MIRDNKMMKKFGGSASRGERYVPAKCKHCGKDLKPSKRLSTLEVCAKCLRDHDG